MCTQFVSLKDKLRKMHDTVSHLYQLKVFFYYIVYKFLLLHSFYVIKKYINKTIYKKINKKFLLLHLYKKDQLND